MAEQRTANAAELQEMVARADFGAREPLGLARRAIFGVAVAWSLFQVWYASPLPFLFGFGILNDTEARAIHLAFAVFLAFTAYPAFRTSPRQRIPMLDWGLALVAVFAASYLFWFYVALSTRPGQPTWYDMAVSTAGILVLLEATRRSLGLPLVLVALAFMFYTFAGPWMPEAIQHKGASLERFLSHQWLTTEGVFGVPLGVSTNFVFLFVLFGSLLEKAGGGNYMMQVSFALLGHLRGGPAKVAVVSSALNGVISGSSVSNVVTGGIFTIPMMKRTGLSGVKAGAIETASSINGQIMPPVMGAAAFLMAEYVGVPYAQIVKHAFLPAVISYIGLLYIVHLEALKIGAAPLSRAVERTPSQRMLRLGIGISGTLVVCGAIYYGILAVQAVTGAAAGIVIGLAGVALYLGLLWYAARFPDLAIDDPNKPMENLQDAWPVVRVGLHFLLPLVVLVWCLMVELFSPGLSAFWATVAMMAILATQRPIIALFRGHRDLLPPFRQGISELIDGLNIGARSMIGIGVATATAGIVVGTITLTGMGLMMTEFVELISGDSVILMLLFTAAICLVLGMGIPTTANYILVATLMAPVIVELGAQSGLAIPLVCVHMFVFYFGIMADVTPPVGLASYAAAAISGDDPIKTGLQGSVYALRTALLPFIFIFNPQLLFIDVHSWGEGLLVIVAGTLAMLLFCAATMHYFLVRSRWWETATLLLICFTLFRPDFWLDLVDPPYTAAAPAQILEIAEHQPEGARLALQIEGLTLDGDIVNKTVSVPLGQHADGAARLASAGVTVRVAGDEVIVDLVRFGSYAARIGLETGQEVTAVLVPSARPSKHIMIIPALALLGVVIAVQWRRRARSG
jgi:TRAP transporter 4TM/12TM fusion protein